MRSKIIISVAFICMFLLAGSASAAVDFPADEAGIAAYVRANSSIDLNDAKSAFTSIERETTDYIIGTVPMWGHTEQQQPHVYVSNDGWIVAYYPKDRSSGWIMPWGEYTGGPISSTTLSKAIVKVGDVVGGTAQNIKYYDFRHPNASKMMIIIESTTGTEFFKVKIPTAFTTYAVDWSHYTSTSCSSLSRGSSYVYLNNTLFNSFGCGTTHRFGFLLDQFNNGVEHEVKIRAVYGTARIGLVLEYAE